MSIRRTGIVAGVALAAGLAIGTVASATAANPTFDPGRHPMMGGASFGPGMMGGGMMGGYGSGSGYGPGMMGNLSPADREKLLQQCDEMHDAMHESLNASPTPSR
jgi:hypothetical protein